MIYVIADTFSPYGAAPNATRGTASVWGGKMSGGFTDPFGAPEIYVDGVAWREMVGSEIVRSAFFATDHGERIIRLKLLIPVSVCSLEHGRLHSFIAMQPGQRLAS